MYDGKFELDRDEYDRRCNENVAACERIGGKLSDKDLQTVGVMVYRQMKAENRARMERKQG